MNKTNNIENNALSDEKKGKAAQRIQDEIAKIVNKENKLFFFVIDTQGIASGSLAYIYQLAKIAHEAGYNVTMVHNTPINEKEDEGFIGVGSWLGEEYASLPHANIQTGNVAMDVSDVIFIPEIYSKMMLQMKQLKNLHAKRIAIMQNLDYLIKEMPYAGTWSDYGVFEAIANTEENANLLKRNFPNIKTTVIEPYIEPFFGDDLVPKKPIINVAASDIDDVTRLVKQFRWQYPQLQWVSFRAITNTSRKEVANMLREGFLTVWMDDDSSFGYIPLESMACKNLVLARIPKETKRWMVDDEGKLNNSCIWFNDVNYVQDELARIVRAFITNTIPSKLYEYQEEALKKYSYEKTKETWVNYLNGVMDSRKNELENVLAAVHVNEKKTDEE